MKSLFESITTEEKILLENINQLNEGWAIFESIGNTNQWQIERIDEDARFESDIYAIKHVYKMALNGSKIHSDALQFMSNNATATENLFICSAIVK